MRIKKIIALLMCLVMALPLFGCSFIENAVDRFKNDPKKQEKADAEQIFEYLKEEDIDSLCELFSPEVRKTHSLKSEWKYFFKKLDGNVVSYKKLQYQNEGYGVDKDGEVYDSHFSVNYSGVKTDNGTVYKQFGFYHVRVNKNDPDSEGLQVFTMQIPDTGEWITVGGEY